MRFNGIDIYDVHKSISVAKEIPPGAPARTIETLSGLDGEVLAGVVVGRGDYRVRVNIAGRDNVQAWQVRALLAAWASNGDGKTGLLEPTHWPGKAYDAIFESISAPEFKFGFATLDVDFVIPRPYAHDVSPSIVRGNGTVSFSIGGTANCKPKIEQTIQADRSGLTWKFDGGYLLTLNGALTAGQVVKMDTDSSALTIDGEHAEARIDYTGTRWRAGYVPGRHKVESDDGGALSVRWNNTWM